MEGHTACHDGLEHAGATPPPDPACGLTGVDPKRAGHDAAANQKEGEIGLRVDPNMRLGWLDAKSSEV